MVIYKVRVRPLIQKEIGSVGYSVLAEPKNVTKTEKGFVQDDGKRIKDSELMVAHNGQDKWYPESYTYCLPDQIQSAKDLVTHEVGRIIESGLLRFQWMTQAIQNPPLITHEIKNQ